MKCHYEVLGLPLTATSDEIKKSYRKQALEWHPDKNLHRSDEAKEIFQQLQQAYEVLIDPQERAWYDRHREEILKTGLDDEHKNNVLDVFQYFNTSCYKGYGDDENGFYSVYQEVFRKIAAEDEPFMEEDDHIDIPMFGNSTSSYEDVVHNFYAYWQSYCTFKSFSWVDSFNLSDARRSNAGRQILRQMEKENKKLRDQHKKIRNEEVRQLVRFVRKRDKRVQAHKKFLEEHNAERAKKVEEQRKKQFVERKKNFENYQESEWASISNLEENFNEIENHLDSMFGAVVTFDDGEDEEKEEDLYCVACDKDFRSLKSMKNHENSKKHKENVILLKHLMEEEEKEDQGTQPDNPGISLSDLNGVECDENDLEDSELNDISLDHDTPRMSKKKKKKKRRAVVADIDEDDSHVEVQEESNFEINGISTEEVQEVTIDGDSQQQGSLLEPCNPEEPVNTDEIPGNSEPLNTNTKKKKGKLKDAKKNSKPNTSKMNQDEEVEKQSTICEKCGHNYISRNKLFEHLKTSGHAIYLGEKISSNTALKYPEKVPKGRRNRRQSVL